MVKEESQVSGPSAPTKRLAYSITDANSIRTMDPINVDVDPPQAIGKRRRTGTSGASRVQPDGIALPEKLNSAVSEPRRSMRVKKGKGKQGTADLLLRLGQEFRAIAKTCEELGDALD